MRPPHGRYTMSTLRTIQGLGYRVVLWTDDSGDWRTMTPQHIENDMLRHASAPDIVLLHSGKLATIRSAAAGGRSFPQSRIHVRDGLASCFRSRTPGAINHPKRMAV